jgi:ubiquinone/menaquinone biosynthesis C-methylase UbiE
MLTSGRPKESAWAKIETPEAAAEAIGKLDRLGRTAAEAAARRRYLDILDPQPGERILDVGGGSGLATLEIARRVAPNGRAVALDPSPPLLDYARAGAAAAGLTGVVECKVGDARAMPFADGDFNRAFCHWVLLHVSPPDAIVREMRRVVRRGGRVVCVELDWEAPILHPASPEVTRRIFDFCNARHLEQYMGRRLPSIVRACGLTDVNVEPIVLLDEAAQGRQWLDFLKSRVDLARAGNVVSETEAAAWAEDIETAAAERRYLFAVTQFVVSGTVA